MSDHDPMCPRNWLGTHFSDGEDLSCRCDEYAEVRADEREKAAQEQYLKDSEFVAALVRGAGGEITVTYTDLLAAEGSLRQVSESGGGFVISFAPDARRDAETNG